MREALLKKRYGIPAALLILFVSAGVATAVVVDNFSYTTTPNEPLTFGAVDDLGIAYQGDSDKIIVNVSNASGDTTYGILVDATVEGARIDSISYSTTNLFNSEPALNQNLNGDGDRYDAQYNIGPNGSYNIEVTVDSADDIAPEELKVTLGFLRKTEYTA